MLRDRTRAQYPDQLRQNERAVQFVRGFFDAGKPVAAICHGPWMLVEADVVRGRTITSWPSLRTDIRNAGAEWADREVVTDKGLVTSRKPDDIPAFSRKMIEEFAEGVHEGQRSPWYCYPIAPAAATAAGCECSRRSRVSSNNSRASARCSSVM